MIFSSKQFLLLLILFSPALVFLSVYYYKKYRLDVEKFANAKMLPLILGESVSKVRKIREILFVCALIFLLLSLAGPQFGTKMVSIKKKSVDIIIAVDCSKSMLARDLSPDRITKAKDMLAVLVDRLKENRIGIIAFAGTSFTQCPLTFDYNSVKMLLGLIDTDLIPLPGTSIGSAIRLALKSFGEEKLYSKVLVLLTDGEDHKSDPLGAAKEAKEYGVRIYTVGIGTDLGEPLPESISGGQVLEYKKDKKGRVITSKLDEQLLSEIASQTGGRYYPMVYGDVGIAEQIYSDISTMEKKETKGGIYGIYEHRFQIPLFIVVVLMLIEMLLGIDWKFMSVIVSPPWRTKQSHILFFITIFIFFLITPVYATARGEIKKGNRLYLNERYDEALQHYRDALIKEPGSKEALFNSGDVLYKQEDYEGAVKEFSAALGKTKDKKLQSKIYYNIGNAAYMQENTDEALKNYKKALDLNPADEDAKYNIGLILMQKTDKKQQKGAKDKKGKKDKEEKRQEKQEQEKQEDKKQEEKGEKKPEKKKYMSKEDVERLLQMAGEQEKEAIRKKNKNAAPKLPAVEQDW